MWNVAGTPADSFYEVRPECSDVPRTRFKIKVRSKDFFFLCFDHDFDGLFYAFIVG